MDSSNHFVLSVECRVYSVDSSVTVGERSNVIPASFAGFVSLTSEDVSLSDTEVLEILESAHIEDSMARLFIEYYDSAVGCLRQMGIDSGFDVDDVWISCRVSESYLDYLVAESGDERARELIEEFDTPVEVYQV